MLAVPFIARACRSLPEPLGFLHTPFWFLAFWFFRYLLGESGQRFQLLSVKLAFLGADFVVRFLLGLQHQVRAAVQLKLDKLKFHGSSCHLLIVTGGSTQARIRGSGTLNGDLAPDGAQFKCKIWVRDDYPDTFRIKIWYEEAGEVVVYDNGFDQAIGGGQIQIHEYGREQQDNFRQ